jgi:hypothetical protein
VASVGILVLHQQVDTPAIQESVGILGILVLAATRDIRV